MKKSLKMFRQGDVLLREVKAIPADAAPAAKKDQQGNDRVVLASLAEAHGLHNDKLNDAIYLRGANGHVPPEDCMKAETKMGGVVTDQGTYLPECELGIIHYSKHNPRKFIDPKQLDELAASIKEHGVVEPVIIRDHPKQKGEYEMIAGERRHRASLKAGKTTIPAILRVYTDRQAAEVQQIENLQRADVHPMDEAHGFKLLIDKFEYTVDTIAARIGKEPRYVVKRMKLVDLDKKFQDAFWKGELSIGYAEFLCRLPADIQKDLRGSWPNGWIWNSLGQLQRHVEDMAYNDIEKAPWAMDAKNIGGMVDCLSCPQRSGNAALLFPELNDAPNTCTNRACFKVKMDAHIKQTLEANPDLISVSMHYNQPPKGVLARDKYKQVNAKACKYAVKAIVVQGDSRGDGLGSVIHICHAKECKDHRAHHSTRGSGPDPAEAARQRGFRQDAQSRLAMFGAVWAKADPKKVKLGMDELRQIAEETWSRCYNRDKVAKAIGWERHKSPGSHSSYHPVATAFIKKAAEVDLIKLILLLVCGGDVANSSYGGTSKLKELPAVAKRWGVDAEKERSLVLEQLRAKHQARAKSAAKSKKKAKARK